MGARCSQSHVPTRLVHPGGSTGTRPSQCGSNIIQYRPLAAPTREHVEAKTLMRRARAIVEATRDKAHPLTTNTKLASVAFTAKKRAACASCATSSCNYMAVQSQVLLFDRLSGTHRQYFHLVCLRLLIVTNRSAIFLFGLFASFDRY